MRRSAGALFIFLVVAPGAASQDPPQHSIVPLNPAATRVGAVEKVWGNPDVPGMPFVIRIHNDAGYIVLPHTHPEDEHIVVVKGNWSLAMGARFSRAALEPLEVGSYGFVPRKMAHYGRATTDLTIQVHGIGPFSTDFVDPVYQLSGDGVDRITTAGKRKDRVEAPSRCFTLRLGERVRGRLGEGNVVGALCSPSNQLTQYWIQRADGSRFWSAAQELVKP
jgi:hypothetical protein